MQPFYGNCNIFTLGNATSCLCLIVSAILIAWLFICLKMIESNIYGYGGQMIVGYTSAKLRFTMFFVVFIKLRRCSLQKI